MATKHYENGIIGSTEGGYADFSSDIFTTGTVFWVSSVTGNDANAGTNRTAPKATLDSALTAAVASNGDIIFLESGHSETLSSAITFSEAGIIVVGLGSGTNKPRFTVNAAIDGFSIAANLVELYNLRFPIGTTTANTSRINVGGAGVKIYDCDFLCGANDLETITIPDAGDHAEISGCSFTISADGADSAIRIESASNFGVNIFGCTFDGGSFDFDDAALYSTVAHTDYLYRNNILTNKASIIHTAAATGRCTGTVAGDGSRVQI